MIWMILLGYVLPAIMVFLLLYFFDDELITVGDFLDGWYFIFVPILNILALFTLIIGITAEKINLNFNIGGKWNKFKNIKIK